MREDRPRTGPNGNEAGEARVLRTIAQEVRRTVKRHAPHLLSRYADDIVANVQMAMLGRLHDIEHVPAYARRVTARQLTELNVAEKLELLQENEGADGAGNEVLPFDFNVDQARETLAAGLESRADARQKASAVSPIVDTDSAEARALKVAVLSRGLIEASESALGQLSPEEQLECLSDELRTSGERDFVWALWALLDARRMGALEPWGERGRNYFRQRSHRAPYTCKVEHLARRLYAALLRAHHLGLPTRARLVSITRILGEHDDDAAPWRGLDLALTLTPVIDRIGAPAQAPEPWARRGARRILKRLGVPRQTADACLKDYQ